MSWTLYTILGVPLAAVLLALFGGWRLARAATVLAGAMSLGFAVADRDRGRARTGSGHGRWLDPP